MRKYSSAKSLLNQRRAQKKNEKISLISKEFLNIKTKKEITLLIKHEKN